MKVIFLLILLLISLFCFGQEPATYINVKLLNNNKEILEDKYSNYTIFFRQAKVLDGGQLDTSLSTFYYQKREEYHSNFQIIERSRYCKTILELTIVHYSDTMTVLIQRDSIDAVPVNCTMTTNFFFEVPFQKGYYETRDLVKLPKNDKDSKTVYAINQNYKWIPLPIEQRRLNILPAPPIDKEPVEHKEKDLAKNKINLISEKHSKKNAKTSIRKQESFQKNSQGRYCYQSDKNKYADGYYFAIGSEKEICFYRRGKLKKIWDYYDNKRLYVSIIEKHKLNKRITTYYNSDGSKKSRTIYKNNKQYGKCIEWDQSGKKKKSKCERYVHY